MASKTSVNLVLLRTLNGGWVKALSHTGDEDHAMHKFISILRDTRGATAIEYGLIAALIAVAAITAMSALGNSLVNTFGNVSNNMKAS